MAATFARPWVRWLAYISIEGMKRGPDAIGDDARVPMARPGRPALRQDLTGATKTRPRAGGVKLGDHGRFGS